MKPYFLLFFLLISNYLFSQELQEINAVQKADKDFFDYEDYDENEKPIGDLVFLKGCSWYCGGSIENVISSSELESSKSNYSAKNIHDFNKNTAWVEGVEGNGIGEFIEFTFKNKLGVEHFGINQLLIANGYKKNKDLWKKNGRVKKLKMIINDKPVAFLNLEDSFEIQVVNIPKIKFPINKITKIRFVIEEVYQGIKYEDTAISLLMFNGFGVH